MIKSFLFFVLIVFMFVIFETAVLSNLLFLPAVPDFLLICVLYVSLNNGKMYGCSSGFISGFFLDFLSISPFGLNCLLRTIIGYIAGCFNKTLNINGVFLPAFIGFCGTIIKSFILWIISIFFQNSVNSYGIFTVSFGFELIANSLLTPVIFKFLSIFDQMLLLDVKEIS